MSVLDMIEQPTLLLNENIAKHNLELMSAKIKKAGVKFRPHFKTHQSAEIGEWFRMQGVDQITVSSVEMAEYFADHFWDDILIAFSLNIRQLARIQALAKRVKLGLLIENTQAVEALASVPGISVNLWIKIDVGAHRTGIDWQESEQVEDLIRAVNLHPGLHFRGLLTHSGNTYHCESPEQVVEVFRKGVERMNVLREVLKKRGIFNVAISVGDTPGCSLCNDFSGIDELRPGNFIFYDSQQLQAGVCKPAQVAVAVACPVVAIHPDRKEVVVYGGAVHLSKDLLVVDKSISYGLPAFILENGWSNPIVGAIVRSLTQEHGVIRFSNDQYMNLKIGDLLFILPAHSCLTVDLMRKYLTLSGRVIETMG